MGDPRESLLAAIRLDSSRVKPFEGFIFLCGGAIDATAALPTSIREALARALHSESTLTNRVRLAENYQDWAYESHYKDLIVFEKHLAELSSLIVLILESPGSLAELGLFSVVEQFREKLFVVVAEHYYESTSFIRLGPIDHLEKSFSNLAYCYEWAQFRHNQIVFDPAAANELQPDLVAAIQKRLRQKKSDSAFDEGQWLHKALLVCELISVMSALALNEIHQFLDKLGVTLTLNELKQTLFILERVDLLKIIKRGEQRLYVSVVGRQFMTFRFEDRYANDLDRFRNDIVEYYKVNEKWRFKVIQRAIA